MPSLMPPCIWASRPRGLIGSPASIANVTRVTLGPVTASRTLRLTVLGRQSISTRQAVAPLYSSWIAMPCAVPGFIALPHWPTSATLSSTARTRSLLRCFLRNW